MLNVVPSNRFKKDLRLAVRRGCDMALLDGIIGKLADGEALPENAATMI